MTLGLVGRKIGMTRVFTDDGSPVQGTVLGGANHRVTPSKTPAADGASAIPTTPSASTRRTRSGSWCTLASSAASALSWSGGSFMFMWVAVYLMAS